MPAPSTCLRRHRLQVKKGRFPRRFTQETQDSFPACVVDSQNHGLCTMGGNLSSGFPPSGTSSRVFVSETVLQPGEYVDRDVRLQKPVKSKVPTSKANLRTTESKESKRPGTLDRNRYSMIPFTQTPESVYVERVSSMRRYVTIAEKIMGQTMNQGFGLRTNDSIQSNHDDPRIRS